MHTRKNLLSSIKTDEEIIKSYNEIALQPDIRKATVSDTFNAKSKSGPNSTTMILIIEAMGYTLGDFSNQYDSITQSDIENFIKRSKL
ncbi:hypothetical protein M0G43_11855 [Subsaxibacter sp. CAU 1640]|uniref:hypothetical protein n=1 Tax=Subsaxibacter sp. CAU 1640 TaxID=2933271 RepID=UPI0020045935|nr:hypothetical protein [Subsaxibacter sp. CAU 1640]MCK7591271.1 hypothetical protein [Subsaxibacter sp. CAU 1640]